MATHAESLGRPSSRPNSRGGTRQRARSPRPSQSAGLRVVPKSGAGSARQSRRLLVTVCAVLTVALAFGVAVSQVIVAQNQDRLDKLNRRLDAAQTRYDQLRYQVAELESPERIVAAAHDRLGMIEPAEVNYVAPIAANNRAVEEGEVTEAPDWRLVKAELAAK